MNLRKGLKIPLKYHTFILQIQYYFMDFNQDFDFNFAAKLITKLALYHFYNLDTKHVIPAKVECKHNETYGYIWGF